MERIPEEIILDASVVAKWFTEEENTAIALEIRDKYYTGEVVIYAPDLLVYEVENALRCKPGTDEKLVSDWIRDLLDMQLELIAPSHELDTRSIQLSFKHDISTYDSTYLALAELLNTKLITDDERLHEKTKKTERVLKLAELS